ncbi:MAG: LysM peptidoglycan-binding domain-containing protein [Alphaproteobacteria bacterium]
MGYHAIVALFLLAGALGVAYVAFDPFGTDLVTTDEAAPSATQGDDQASADPASRPAIQGSAARRMDDFGAGPGGAAITGPLRSRYQQAYTGGAAGGGGASTKAADTVAGSGPGQQEVETAALAPEGAEPTPSVRVIDRPIAEEPSAIEPAAGQAGAAADADPVPSFDVVRVDPDGRTVMAGRAAPLTDVEIKVGDEVIDRVTTSATGEWVSIPSEPLAAGDQELSLTAVPKDADPVDSRQVVVVSVPEPAATEHDQPVAVVVDKDEGGEGRILQAPDKLQSPGDERLALKLVDYDDRGAIRLSGEAPPGVPVRIYVDNVPAALVIGDSKGYWITTLDQDLPGGDYTLRLDQLDHKGATVARLETPLTRVATPPIQGQAKVDYVVVQPGNSLWRIARRLSGDGFNYVYIFEANNGQIRDPDIIYPGQVFEVPADVLPAPG